MANGDTKFSYLCIMAHYSYPISYLLTIALVFSVQIEARESKFFTKAVIHYNTNTNTTTNNATTTVEPPSPSPSPSPFPSASPSEAPAPTESESGYGLYGQSVAEFANTFDNNEGEIPAEEFKELSNKEYSSNNNNNYNNGFPTNYNEHAYVTVPQESSDTKFMENGNTPNFYEPKFNEQFPQENLYKENNKGYANNYNNGFPTNYNEHAYVTVPQESSDTKFMENGNTPNFYEPKFNEQFPQDNLYKENNNKGYANNYNEKFPDENRYKENNNGYTASNYNENYANEREPQGMSDTRFVENGKYYYNPKKERNYEGVEERRGNNNERYYGNSFGERSKYEFDSMEEYDRQQGYTQTDLP